MVTHGRKHAAAPLDPRDFVDETALAKNMDVMVQLLLKQPSWRNE